MRIKAVRDMSIFGITIQELVKYSFESDACIDLVCCQTSHLPAFSGLAAPIPTGIAIELPPGFFGLILPRSGLAKQYRLGILGGVIDNGYRGEICVNLINYGNRAITFGPGDRVAQLAVLPYFKANLEWVLELSPTDRGEQGHGSTGI